MTERTLEQQAVELHELMAALIKKYQSRDRSEICCYGISVAQCHTMRAIAAQGKPTMKQIADDMHLTVSTMTRIVDQLVDKELATRFVDANDRRLCLVELTARGKKLLDKIEGEVLQVEKEILRRITPGDRTTLVLTLRQLLEAFDSWRSACGTEPIQIRRQKHASKVKR